jgi:hypothetical protein
MGRSVEEQASLRAQVRCVLQDPAAARMIVVRIVEQRRAYEQIAARKRRKSD